MPATPLSGWRSRSPTLVHVQPIDLLKAATRMGVMRADTVEWALVEVEGAHYWLTRSGAMLPAGDERPLQIDVIYTLRDNQRAVMRIPLTDARALLEAPMNLAAWVDGEAYDEVRYRLHAQRR